DRRGDRVCGLRRARPRVGGEAEGQAVGFPHRVVEALERIDHRHRAEGLDVHRLGVVGDFGDHGRFEEIALVADAVAAGAHFAAVLLRVLDAGFHRARAARIGERAHRRARLQAVADLERLRRLDELVHEAVVDAFLHEEAGRRYADLAGIAVFARGHGPGRDIDVRVVEY